MAWSCHRVRVAAAILVWLSACAPTEPGPELFSVAPSVVNGLEATPVVATGAHLYDAVKVDLDSTKRPTLRRDWRVRLGDSGEDLADVERVDTQTLRFVVPAHTPPGTYDVTATSPLGVVVRLAAGLTVLNEVPDAGAQSDASAQPDASMQPDAGAQLDSGMQPAGVVVLSIEDAPGGRGKRVSTLQATTDQAVMLYAVLRDAQGNFVANEAVRWSVSGGIARSPDAETSRLTLALDAPGSGSLSARDADGREASVDALQVVAGHAHALELRPSEADVQAGDAAIQFSVRATDADGNATDDLGALSWSIADGTITRLDASSGLFTPELAGTGHVHVVSAYGVAATSGDIRVRPGPLATLVPQPNTATLSADDAPLTFSASGRDAFGNDTSALGTLSWTISSGPITALSSAGLLTPTHAGIGRIRVDSSLGPSASSGDIQITPGHAATLTLTPTTLSATIGDPATQFSAAGSDADGNPTLDLGTLGFSIASGPITAIRADGLFSPTTGGDGSVRVTSSYGATATSGTIHVVSYLTSVHLSAVRVPYGFWPTQDNAPIEVDVVNDGTRDVLLTGVYFTLTNGGSDVSSQYSIRPDYANSDRVPPGATITLVHYVDVSYPVTSGTLRLTANVDAISPFGAFVTPTISTTVPVYGTTFGPTITLIAPVPPNNRLCKGASAAFNTTTTGASSPIFTWLFPSGLPSSSSMATPTVQYTQVGAFEYSAVVTDAWGLDNVAVPGNLVFVGEPAPGMRQSYPTGGVRFSAPLGGLSVDMATLPRTDLISLDAMQPLRQCNGMPLDPMGAHYVTLFTDRGRIDPNADMHPELPGIQVDVNPPQGTFSNVRLLSDNPALEGAGTLYAEYFQPDAARVTAAGFATFQMTGDQQAPRVIDSLPSADCTASCYPKGAAFAFRFSEPLNASSVSNVKVERLSGGSCNSGVFSDLSGLSIKSYDAAARTLYVIPPSQSSSSYLVRVSLGTQLTDTAATPNALVPFVRCAGVASFATPATPQPVQTSLSASVFSPDGDGVADTLTWNATVDASARVIQLRVLRAGAPVWSQTAFVSGAGTYPLTWDGRDASGRTVFNGYYRYDITAYSMPTIVSDAVSGVIQVDSAARQVGVRRRY